MKICIIGAGYVGLVNAIWLQDLNHEVVLVEKNPAKLELLNQNRAPFYEPEIDNALKNLKCKIVFTNSIKQVRDDQEVYMICVGTPENDDGSVNLTSFNGAIKDIINNIKKDCSIIIKSTVPVGTAKKVKDLIKGIKYRVSVISNPEFLSQGKALNDTYNPSRVIVGMDENEDKSAINEIYEFLNVPIIFMSNESAELVKYTANNFLALKISFINEIANLCEIVGADIDDVTKGIGSDPRIGEKFLAAGIGYGGSCFPKDTKATHYLAKINDYELKTIKATIEVNEVQKMRLLEKARKHFSSFNGLKIAILGVTFKPNTDDLREAPALASISVLLDEGAHVTVFDPLAGNKIKELFKHVIVVDNIESAIKDADMCLIFTEWDIIKNTDLHMFKRLMKKPLVIDGRNCYSLSDMAKLGIIYESIGRKS